MNSTEAKERAEALRDTIFNAYNLIQHVGGDPHSVRLPRNGDWVQWIANEIERASRRDRNMDGAEEFVRALMLNQPIWPNPWGQDVAAAAYAVSRLSVEFNIKTGGWIVSSTATAP